MSSRRANDLSSLVDLRLPHATRDRLKAWASVDGIGYTTLMKVLIDEGLERRGPLPLPKLDRAQPKLPLPAGRIYPKGAAVYLLRSHGPSGVYKIGYTTDVNVRVPAIQAEHPAELELMLLLVPGSKGLEDGVHMLFAAHRAKGEWFYPHMDLVAWVEARRSEATLWEDEVSSSEGVPAVSIALEVGPSAPSALVRGLSASLPPDASLVVSSPGVAVGSLALGVLGALREEEVGPAATDLGEAFSEPKVPLKPRRRASDAPPLSDPIEDLGRREVVHVPEPETLAVGVEVAVAESEDNVDEWLKEVGL